MFEFRLDPDIFEVVKNGTKRVEVRLYDEKRKKMNIGDELVFFKRPLEEEKLVTVITNLKRFKAIEELLSNYQMKDIYIDGTKKDDFIKLLGRFYSKEEQENYGIVAIEFEVV